ncbi:MAG: FlgD immunoglobulin-like domain containing protein [Ardenticatenaceae bacterium]
MIRPNLVSLIIAMAVIGLLVFMFPMEWISQPKITVEVDRSVFSPNNDGVQEEVAAFYVLSEHADVTAVVQNSAALVIRTLINDQPQSEGQHIVTWDGRDDSGQSVSDGSYQIAIRAAGIARQSEHSAPVEVDITPPSLQLANFSNENRTTREASFTLEGTTDPNVKVWVAGEPVPINVNPNGVFRINRSLEEGPNPLQIRAVDGAGNETLISRTITLRTHAPELSLLEPAQNNMFVSNKLMTVRGMVPPDVKVSVNGREASVNAEGEFMLDLVLEEGENLLKVVAVDPVGNESPIERRINLSTRGPTIAINNLSNGMTVYDPSVRASGTVNPGSQLQVNGNTTPIDANGNFSTLVPLQAGNNLITFTAKDIAGNATSVQHTVHYATSKPITEAPSLTLPDLPNSPWLWRVLIGVGLVGGGLWLFSGFASPIAFELTTDYPVFYPNRADEQRMLIMRMYLSRAAKVDLDVYDEFNRHIVTLIDADKKSVGEHFRLWDGRNALGDLLQGGSYLVQATASTTTNSPTRAVWVRLDPSPSPVKAEARTTTTQGRDRWVDEEQIIDIG